MTATSKERRSREKKVGSDLATIGSDNTVDKSVNRTQLQLIIAGLTDGVDHHRA